MLKTSKQEKKPMKQKSLSPKSEKPLKDRIYQLQISLTGSKPLICRRVLVSGGVTLKKLHKIIQETMGWTDSHLHEFIVGETSYTEPDPEMDFGRSKNEGRFHLYEITPNPKMSFLYIYDFGDGWEHTIKVEKILDEDARYQGRPVCFEGEMARPPEDCSGIHGFYEMMRIRQNPKHPEYEEVIQWLGDEFDPDFFDLEETNIILKHIR